MRSTRGWGATIQGAATMGEGSHAQEHGGPRESGEATRLHDDVHSHRSLQSLDTPSRPYLWNMIDQFIINSYTIRKNAVAIHVHRYSSLKQEVASTRLGTLRTRCNSYPRKLPVILPHELIPHVLAHQHLDLQQLTTEAAAYWTHMREHSGWAQNHPGTNRHQPLFLYGDDARFSQNEKLTVVYCGFCLDSRTHSMCVHLPLFIIRCSLSVGFETLQAFLKPVSATAEQQDWGSSFSFQ